MTINISTQDLLSQQKLYEICHNNTILPAGITIYILALLIFAFLSIFVNKESKSTFWRIWIFFALLFLIIIIMIIFLPNVMFFVQDFFTKLFS